MKIGVIGTRGFPDIQGGLETHVMELYTRVAALGNIVITIYRRTPYIYSKNKNATFKNVRFVDLYVPKSKYLEAFLHSFFSTIHAIFQNYDIVHFHNTGPGFFIPILKLSRTKIVFTYHNISYTQRKWNKFAKWFLRLSEKISLRNSDYVIFVSEIIKSEMVRKYKIKNYGLILNGVDLPEKSVKTDYLESLGLEKQKYILGVGRYLEEKGFDYLIRSFKKAYLKDYKLVIVGDTDYPTKYSNKLKAIASQYNVVLTGFIKGEKLNQIFSNARLFIMSSFEEGLPIALLEAMSYKIDLLASNIPAHLQIGLNIDDYFKVGDEDDLSGKIIQKLTFPVSHNYSEILTKKYNWDSIAGQTYEVYNSFASS